MAKSVKQTGKTFKLKARAVKVSKKLKVDVHRKVSYVTGNKKVARVTKTGKIIAVGKGTTNVYAFAQNGVCKKIKVTVK